MKEYIERGEQESILKKRYYELAGMRPDFYAGYMTAFHIIEDDIPNAADVVEVRHGRWEWNENAMDWGLGGWVCSECRAKNDNIPAKPDTNPTAWSGSHYCPNCGAKMDKEE